LKKDAIFQFRENKGSKINRKLTNNIEEENKEENMEFE